MRKFILVLVSLTTMIMAYGQPTLQWAKSIGGSQYDKGMGIASDALGNVYVTGSFDWVDDFDPGAAVYNLTSAGSEDIFISKFDSSGNFVWTKSIGGVNYDRGSSIVIDASGNVYTTGWFTGTVDFDPSDNVYNLTGSGGQDIFVSKLDALGNFIWAKNIGGMYSDYGNDIAIDLLGNVYITGSFKGTADFDPGVGVYNLTSNSGDQIFISKLNSSGAFVWAKNMRGIGNGFSIAIDMANNVYTTGRYLYTVDFDPGAGVYNLTSVGAGDDIFVSKLDASGAFVWAKRMGGTEGDHSRSIAVDGSGNVYTTGVFQDTADFDPGAGVYNLAALTLGTFVSKLDAWGNFVWAKQLGSDSFGLGVVVDKACNVYTTGRFSGTGDFDPEIGIYTLTTISAGDVFVSKLDSSGTFIWAEQMRGSLESLSTGNSIFIDVAGNIYFTGWFEGTVDCDPRTGIYNLTALDMNDIFIVKLSGNSVGISEEYNSFKTVNVFPNPNQGSFKIQIDKDIKNGKLILINSIGQKVHEQKVVQGSNEIKTNGLPIGMYNYILFQNRQIMSNGKLTIE
jgi:hypothetical protein